MTKARITSAARLAQSVEHETLNLRVVGSSSTLGVYFDELWQYTKSVATVRVNNLVSILFHTFAVNSLVGSALVQLVQLAGTIWKGIQRHKTPISFNIKIEFTDTSGNRGFYTAARVGD